MPDEAVNQMRWSKEHGACAVLMRPFEGNRLLVDPYFYPIYEEASRLDMAIAIRTAVVKDQRLYVQAGAGIVADSVPQSEWDETMNKARAVFRAVNLALGGLNLEDGGQR